MKTVLKEHTVSFRPYVKDVIYQSKDGRTTSVFDAIESQLYDDISQPSIEDYVADPIYPMDAFF